MSSSEEKEYGSTVVIHHRVRGGHQIDYDHWLTKIAPSCKSAPGYLDWQIIRPIAGLTENYCVIIRFDSHPHLQQWITSGERQRLIDKVRPFLALNDAYTIHSGLDFLFTPASPGGKVPVRWKQFLLTWSAIYPLALGVPMVVLPGLRMTGWPENRLFTTLLVTGSIVVLMVYVVMPRYTNLVRKWLYGK
jgi:antibiotic biosynthesis monooxygenase (ABM) superfamily enzyme